MELQLKIEGYEQIQRRLAALPERLQKNILRGGMRAATKVLRDAARAQLTANGSVRTGTLRKSIRTSAKVLYGGEQIIGRVLVGGAGARHSHLVEFGTKPHLIRARNAKALAIASGSQYKTVRHPGARPKPYMAPALEQKGSTAVDVFRGYVESRVQRFWLTGR